MGKRSPIAALAGQPAPALAGQNPDPGPRLFEARAELSSGHAVNEPNHVFEHGVRWVRAACLPATTLRADGLRRARCLPTVQTSRPGSSSRIRRSGQNFASLPTSPSAVRGQEKSLSEILGAAVSVIEGGGPTAGSQNFIVRQASDALTGASVSNLARVALLLKRLTNAFEQVKRPESAAGTGSGGTREGRSGPERREWSERREVSGGPCSTGPLQTLPGPSSCRSPRLGCGGGPVVLVALLSGARPCEIGAPPLASGSRRRC